LSPFSRAALLVGPTTVLLRDRTALQRCGTQPVDAILLLRRPDRKWLWQPRVRTHRRNQVAAGLLEQTSARGENRYLFEKPKCREVVESILTGNDRTQSRSCSRLETWSSPVRGTPSGEEGAGPTGTSFRGAGGGSVSPRMSPQAHGLP
jgi:hypothetical protein